MSDSIKDRKNNVQDDKSTGLSVFNRLKGLLINDYHTFVVKKLERLTSALYVITGFLPQDEPVRNRLRECSLGLIAKTSDPSKLLAEGLADFNARSTEIVTLLQTARSAGLISPMNAGLLSNEYTDLVEFVNIHLQKIQERHTGGSGSKMPNSKGLEVELKGHNLKSFKQKSGSFKGTSDTSLKNVQTKRRKSIIELLNKRDKISIKDAALVITGFSEKTIQRELLSLVRDGFAIKEGERRWSTYRRIPADAVPEIGSVVS